MDKVTMHDAGAESAPRENSKVDHVKLERLRSNLDIEGGRNELVRGCDL
jgi:hypothetical protein